MSDVHRQSLSTRALPPRDRLAVWREAYGRTLFNCDIEPLDVPFEAAVELRRFAGAALAHGWRTPAHFTLRREQLASARDEVVLALVLRGSAEVSQLGRRATLGAGEAVLMSAAEVGRHTLQGRGRHLSVVVSRSALAPVLGDVGARLMQPVAAGAGALALLRSYVAGLLAVGPDDGGPLDRLPGQHLRDLVAAVCGTPEPALEGADSGVRAARLRTARQQIEAMLGERELSAETVAAEQGVTADYIRRLFRDEQTSFRDYVLGRRLAVVHAALADPRRAGETVAELALAAGFSDISYFNRCFRRHFGMAPSAHRRAAQEPPRD
jgi:AraC-like DNA-binding protein